MRDDRNRWAWLRSLQEFALLRRNHTWFPRSVLSVDGVIREMLDINLLPFVLSDLGVLKVRDLLYFGLLWL